MRQNNVRFIGITGGIGAGKSEILNYIGRHYRCKIYLADQIANEVKQPGTDCYRRLLELYGKDIAGPDGKIDNARMAARMFADKVLLEKTNGIIHPAVKECLLAHLEDTRQKGDAELFIVEAALLIEGGYGELVDEMWYIYADEKTRRERLRRSRGLSDTRIDSFMSAQLSEEQFRENCDFVIDNSGTLAESFAQIDRKLEAFTWLE